MATKRTTIRNSIAAGLAAWCLSACQPHTAYHSFRTLPSDGWNKGDTLVFTVPRQHVAAGTYQLQIEVRHTDRLSFGNLWMVVYQNAQDSTLFTGDTLRCQLTDGKGHFTGSGLGTFYQQSFPMKEVTLPAGYTPVFKIAHYMKTGRLEGIHDIGIRLIEP